MQTKNQFILNMTVRDYECDLQGIVNNAVYQNYLEHARHEVLKTSGISFSDFHDQGVDLVLIDAYLEYKASLKSNDSFYIKTTLQKKGRLRLIFFQDIYRQQNNELVLKATLTVVSTHLGKPSPLPKAVLAMIEND